MDNDDNPNIWDVLMKKDEAKNAELARLRTELDLQKRRIVAAQNDNREQAAELDQARVQLAGCLCAAEGTGDADKVKQGDYAWTPALQRTVELRAELERAPTATLRQQLAGSQSALSKVMGELTEARAALDKATKSEPFILNDELQHLRTSNHYMTEELTRLRAERKAEAKDLAEARADVQRFEAALDMSQRELAEARKQRDFAKDGEDNMRFLKVLWENECGFYRAQSVARLHEIDISRRTIRALVVAARAGVQSVYSIAQGSWGTKDACINLLRAHVASADALHHYKRGSADGQVMHD